MLVLYPLCFAILWKHAAAFGLFPDILGNAVKEIRAKRGATCGGDVYATSGTAEIELKTELYNGTEFYRANENCIWNVKTSPNHFLILRSEYFSLEESENCDWDYLEITDGDMVSRCCGWDRVTYITTDNEITLRFKSDISYEDLGFKFIIESKQRDSDRSKCDSSIIGGTDSKIMNREDAGTDCFYRIQAPGNKVVLLDLTMLDFGSASCEEESIVFYEGLTTIGEPLAKVCSDTVQGILPFHVNRVFIEYRNTLQQEGERFTIEYSFVEDNFTPAPTPSTTPSPVGGNNDCSRMLKGIDTESGEYIYTAPEYENNKECVLVVRNVMLPGFVVQIEFLYFDIEESDNCTFDSLKIFAGERGDPLNMLGGPYCGESLQDRTFVTSGNSLRLDFKTDVSFALRGFKAKISFVPVSDCTCERNQICIQQGYEKKCIRGRQCTANACQNGGTCIVTGSTQKCYCRSGFHGDHCAESDGQQIFIMPFIRAPQDRSLKRGEGHTEECAVQVPPGERVQYDWTKNGVLIEAYNTRSGFGTYPGGLLQIDIFSDALEGQYSCFASTSSGTAEHTFEYKLVEKCDVRIYPGPQSEKKKINQNALMICHVDSRAKEVRWKKDGTYIDFNANPRFRKMINNFLHIKNVGLSDAGTYACEAEDKNGCYSYKEGTLTVIDVKPLNTYCGISVHDEATLASSRISKGKNARPKENPWHVTFINKNTNAAFCGGTVISQRFILTAAHCIAEFEEKTGFKWLPENVYFLMGTTNCRKRGSETIRTFKDDIVHDQYGIFSRYDSDIALIELDSPIEYTDEVRPICLEPKGYNDKVFLEKSNSLHPIPGKVVGCGSKRQRGSGTSTLQELHLPYVRREECEESLEKTQYTITDRMFCAGSNIALTGDTCGGDSGGGLVMSSSSRWVQTGIVSWGMGCDKAKYYGVYTNVGAFYDWIEGIAKLGEEEVPDFLGQ